MLSRTRLAAHPRSRSTPSVNDSARVPSSSSTSSSPCCPGSPACVKLFGKRPAGPRVVGCLNVPSTKTPYYEARRRVVSIPQPRLCLGMPPGRGHCRVIPRLNRNAKKNRMETCRTRCAPMPHTSLRVGGEGPMGAGPASAVRLLAFCSLKKAAKAALRIAGLPQEPHSPSSTNTRTAARARAPFRALTHEIWCPVSTLAHKKAIRRCGTRNILPPWRCSAPRRSP